MESKVKITDERETGRLEAFSDGVFAIAMTLLALDLQVPRLQGDVSAHAMALALARQWPSYIAFAISFFTVLIMWVNHHTIFNLVHRVNSRLLFANGCLLLLVTTVPFTTALVSAYVGKPAATIACAVYAADFVLISLAFNYTWFSAIHRRALLKSDASEQRIQAITRNYRLGFPLYFTATVGAFFSVTFSLAICAGLCVFWSVTTRDS